MTSLKRSRRRYVLIGISVLLLMPIVMAAFAPLLAPIPSQASGWSAPPLPERDEPLPDFQHLLDPLPLVVRDLPDAPSQQVVDIYDTTSFTDHESALRMVEAAEEAIDIPANLESSWRVWLNSSEPTTVPGSVMDYLQGDPLNADRLSNLAATMFLEVLTRGPRAFDFEGGARVSQALYLLDSTVESFPESRSPLLNLVYIDSLGRSTNSTKTWSGDLDPWLAAHPEDVTALQLSVNLYVNSNWKYVQDKEGLHARAVAMSQSEDPARAAFGYTMLGDIELGSLRFDTPFTFSNLELAPYATMHSARLAIEQYDHALVLADDPAIYAARAFALRLVGDIPDAIATQQRAIELLPESATLRLVLADLYLEQRGTTEQIRASIETARSLEREVISDFSTHEMPRLKEFRPIAGFGELAELASNRPEKFYGYYDNFMAGGRGAGFVVSYDLIPLYEDRPSVTTGLNPLDQAIASAMEKSSALGEPDGVEELLSLRRSVGQSTNWPDITREYYGEASLPVVARLISDPDEMSSLDPESSDVWQAASWLRFMGANGAAIDLCRSAVRNGVDSAVMNQCIAENEYLLGDYETSQAAFEAIDDDLMVGYVAEHRGNVDEAIRRYERVIEGDDEGARGTARLRLADALLDAGDTDRAIVRYDELLRDAAYEPGCIDTVGCPFAPVAAFAQSNRGVATLQALAGDDGAIDCDGEAWEACTAAFVDFTTALETDPYNPVFLMNQAWAARLLDDPVLSQQLMDRALEADQSLYPVLNDAGVFAVVAGDRQLARQHFLDAVAVNPKYDLALWNLGVLSMQDGIGGVFRGQAWLARAIVQNPSLVTESLDFRTDERIYRVEINERLRPGAGWSFGAASSRATVIFGIITLATIAATLAQGTYLVFLNKLQDDLSTRTEAARRWYQRGVRQQTQKMAGDRWLRWILLALPFAVLVFATAWSARHSEPNAAAASVVLAMFAVVLAVVVHEIAHLLVAWRMHAVTQPAQWAPGSILALVLLPFGLSSGPFPGQTIQARTTQKSTWFSLAGPLANLGVAVVAYILFTMQPMPGIRLIAQVQIAAMAYALMPFEPLDGAVLARSHPRVLGVLGGLGLLLGVLFEIDVL